MALIAMRYILVVFWAAVAEAAALGAVLFGSEHRKIIGMTMLLGWAYATLTAYLSCTECPEYYTLGHVYDGQRFERRLVRSLDPKLNALVWGPVASWHVSALFGWIISFCATSSWFSVQITARQLLPILVTLCAVALPVAQYAAVLARDYNNANLMRMRLARMALFPPLPQVPEEFRPLWRSVNARNLAGYTAIVGGGLAVGFGSLAARAYLSIFA